MSEDNGREKQPIDDLLPEEAIKAANEIIEKLQEAAIYERKLNRLKELRALAMARVIAYGLKANKNR